MVGGQPGRAGALGRQGGRAGVKLSAAVRVAADTTWESRHTNRHMAAAARGSCPVGSEATSGSPNTRQAEAAGGPHLCPHERWRHILQLQRGQRWQLLVDALEHVVVQVPGLQGGSGGAGITAWVDWCVLRTCVLGGVGGVRGRWGGVGDSGRMDGAPWSAPPPAESGGFGWDNCRAACASAVIQFQSLLCCASHQQLASPPAPDH